MVHNIMPLTKSQNTRVPIKESWPRYMFCNLLTKLEVLICLNFNNEQNKNHKHTNNNNHNNDNNNNNLTFLSTNACQ